MPLHTDPKKVAKSILPAGFTDYTHDSPLANFHWRKQHGHAGSSMIERALERARVEGFVASASKTSSSGPPPYGSGCSGRLHHPDGWELEHYSSYGRVAYDNSFSISLKQVKPIRT